MQDIKAIRLQLGLSQAQLGEHLGIHQSFVSRLERKGEALDTRTQLAVEAVVKRLEAEKAQSEQRAA